ncbi:hypothetical protein [Parvularcula maris]|uniref:Uncharacterized protein n=1 Tax=Parvularcula maris TaxID=2965077 RepID=A0A9X2L7B3_9PROT|nr:hypothetical protein [Parvularcula maris]MCQ8184400.1 hypothetical protein [Parvularcula maris]
MQLLISMLSPILLASPAVDHARLDMVAALLAQEPTATCSCEVTRTEGSETDEECAYIYRCTNGLNGETTASCNAEEASSSITKSMCEERL